jgi:hypothetical protein
MLPAATPIKRFQLPSCRQFWLKDDVQRTKSSALSKTSLWLMESYRTRE